jgi:hypothetical protein
MAWRYASLEHCDRYSLVVGCWFGVELRIGRKLEMEDKMERFHRLGIYSKRYGNSLNVLTYTIINKLN